MAAALIPLIAPVATEVIIPLVVKLVDRLFPPKSGAAKTPAATEIVAAIQSGLQNVNALAGDPLTGPQIVTGVQAAVNSLNARGVLQGAATVIDAPPTQASGVPMSKLFSILAEVLAQGGK